MSVFDAKGKGLDVGLVCHGWVPDLGGVESHTRDLARELATRGHRVHVLCVDYAEGLEPYSTRTSEVDGVRVRRMAYRYHDHGALADVVENQRAEDVVHAWLAEVPCDVVHVQHPTAFGIGALRAIADVGRPMVMTLHDYWPLCPRGQMMRPDGGVCAIPEPEVCGACIRATWPHLMPSGSGEARGPGGGPVGDDVAAAGARTSFALEALQLPQRLFTPSQAARQVYLRAGVEPDRIAVCENGIDVARLAADVARLRAERDVGEVRLGVLGTVLPSKGALELARAFVVADVPGLTLEIHGNMPSYHGDESYVEALRSLAAENERIRLHGPYELARLGAILAQLDGVAAPSRWTEVYGLTVREASAAGLPVLVSDAGDLAAVACGGEAGIVVPVDDDGAWIAALRVFGTDAEARARWGSSERKLRTAREMMLQLERAYVEVFRAETGQEPELAYPIDGADEADPAPAPATPARRVKGRGFLRRLFGNDS